MIKNLAFMAAIALVLGESGSPAQAQFVMDTAFCLSIRQNQCPRVVPDGTAVSLGSLPIIDGHRAVYFWANLRAANSIAVTIAMVRDGTCYKNEIKIPQDKFERNPTTLQTIWAYISSVRMSDLLEAFDIKKATGEVGVNAGVDAKLNIAIVPQANRYRVHDFRFLLCPGAIHARALDSTGEPIPGSNGTKSLTIVE